MLLGCSKKEWFGFGGPEQILFCIELCTERRHNRRKVLPGLNDLYHIFPTICWLSGLELIQCSESMKTTSVNFSHNNNGHRVLR